MSLKVGIVGAGHIAECRHIPVFKNHPETELVGIFDEDSGVTDSVAARYSIRGYDELSNLIEAADLISICTPPSAHASVTIKALDAGCHVLTEKPMAMSTAQADEMIQAAEENSCTLSVVHNMQFMDSMEAAREAIAEFGEVNSIRTFLIKRSSMSKEYLEDASPQRWASERFWDESPHMTYLIEGILGDIKLDDTTLTENDGSYSSIKSRFLDKNGREATMSINWDSPISEWWFVVFCDGGVVLVDLYRDMMLKFGKEREHGALSVISTLTSGIWQLSKGGFLSGIDYVKDVQIDGLGIPDSGFSKQVDMLIYAIQNGTEPPVPGTEGQRILQHMEDIAYDTNLAAHLQHL